MTVALVLLVFVPVIAGGSIWALGDRRSGARAALVLISLSVTLGLAVAVAVQTPALTVLWGTGLSLHLGVAGVARAPVVLVAFVGLAVAVYALAYGEVAGRARMVGLLVTFVGAMELLLLAGDWLTLLTAWELVGILSWALIANYWRGDAPAQAAQAFLTTRVSDLGLFVAAGGAFASTGSLQFSALQRASGGWATVIVVGVLAAAAVKSAQLPFSPWLFSAMAGPTPASALLHSATMVAAGAYLLARLHPFLDTVSWFAPVAISIGLGTALVGGVVALTQPEAKKLLAASTSAHYGLMFVAVGAGYPTVAIAHLVAHGLFKALLFISAGAAIDESGSSRLADMRLGRRLPAIAGLTLVGSLALAAVPPLGGAWTKEQIVAASGERAPWLAALVVLAGALSAAYAARFQLLVWGRTASEGSAGADDRPGGLHLTRVALAGLAAGSIVLGVLWLPFGEERLVDLDGGALPVGAAWEVFASQAAIALVLALAVVADRRSRLIEPWSGATHGRVANWFDIATITRVLVVDPTLSVARAAARFDDRVVDAGIGGTARLATATSAQLARGDDRIVDAGVHGVVRLVAGLSNALAAGDRRAVDAGVRGVDRLGTRAASLLSRLGEAGMDGTVEGLARLAGAAGKRSRRLQSGQTHQYYAGIAIGLVVLVAITALWR